MDKGETRPEEIKRGELSREREAHDDRKEWKAAGVSVAYKTPEEMRCREEIDIMGVYQSRLKWFFYTPIAFKTFLGLIRA